MNYFVINENDHNDSFLVSRKNEVFQFRKNIDNFNINIVEGIRGIGKTSVINKFNYILKNERNKKIFYISVRNNKNFENVKDEFDKNILCLLKEQQNSVVFLNSDNCSGLLDYVKKDILVKSHVFFETSTKHILFSQDIGKIYIYRINEFNEKEIKSYINTVLGMDFYEKYGDFYYIIRNISCGIPKLLNKTLSLILNYEIKPEELANSNHFKNIVADYMKEFKEKFSIFSKELQLLSFNCFKVSFDYFFDNDKFIDFLRFNLMLDENFENNCLRKVFAIYYQNSASKKNIFEIYGFILNKAFENNLFDIKCLEKMLLMSEACDKMEEFVDYTLNNIIPVDVYRNKLNLLSDIVCNIIKKTDYRKFEVEKVRIILKSLMFYNKDIELEKDIEELKDDVEYYSIKANYYMGINDFAKALNSFGKALEKDKDILRQILINYRMSNCYIALHDFNKAYVNFTKTIEITENAAKKADKNDKKSFFIINSIKGSVYRSKGFISLTKYRLYEAIDYFVKAEEKLLLLQDLFGLSATYSLIALCYSRLDKLGLSLKYYRKYVNIEKKLSSGNLKILRLNFIIDFYLILKKTEKANKFIRILESQLERGFLTYRYRIAM
ncbi:MAG: hypothetical protein M0P94_04125, partial [Candidatus Absconditabacterales bacterium]|nr:hypothetical protein [Candidatus Absconditabacterales bacterium]